MTSFIAAGGAGRSTSVIPAVPAASSVTTIAFIPHLPVSSSRLLHRRQSSSHADMTPKRDHPSMQRARYRIEAAAAPTGSASLLRWTSSGSSLRRGPDLRFAR
jgi:hypothetical protein